MSRKKKTYDKEEAQIDKVLEEAHAEKIVHVVEPKKSKMQIQPSYYEHPKFSKFKKGVN